MLSCRQLASLSGSKSKQQQLKLNESASSPESHDFGCICGRNSLSASEFSLQSCLWTPKGSFTCKKHFLVIGEISTS